MHRFQCLRFDFFLITNSTHLSNSNSSRLDAARLGNAKSPFAKDFKDGLAKKDSLMLRYAKHC